MSFSGSWLVRTGFAAAASTPWLIALPVAAVARLVVRAPGFYLDRLIDALPPCDRVILRRPEIRAVLRQDVVEAFRNGHAGFLQDLQLEARPWGLALDRVSCPVTLWHGALDQTVPPIATEALAAVLPQARVRIFPEAGHFFVFDVWGEILRWLLS
jgi:pimeloyl-ACP methyl ester carboxylesterase